MTSSSPSPIPPRSEQEANVQKVRGAIEAFNRRDFDTMVGLAGDDFEYDWTRSLGPNAGVFRGPEGFFEFAQDQWSMFDEVRIEPHEFIPRGPHVVVTATVHGRGRDGISVRANSAHVYTFKNGRMARITLYQKREEALAAAG